MKKLFVLGYALVLCSCQPTHNCQQVADSGGHGTLTEGLGKKKDFASVDYTVPLFGEPIVITNPKKDPASGGSGSTASGSTIHQKKRDFKMPTALQSTSTNLLNTRNHG